MKSGIYGRLHGNGTNSDKETWKQLLAYLQSFISD